ncbi:MAG: 50S ribosomal protein L11 methyltransferase [Gammaproteobacteria bacterium]|nr:50S ribosomal protein L11 methyltransferase [Gammaproteobacteria bacterium]
MPWIQISFECRKELSDTLSDALISAGAVSLTLQDAANQPLLEPGVGETPLWNQVVVTGLFDAAVDVDMLLAGINATIAPAALPPWRVSTIEDKEWEREWMQHFHPMRFGARTWICPSWCKPPDPDAVNIFLDPGLAFGTGTHPTTAMCLEWLDQHIRGGETIIDYGCGSGILGIGALKLGAGMVWAIDNDSQALIATRDNSLKNQVESRMKILAVAQPLPIMADILLANILANPLIALASFFADKIRHGGTAVLSGILAEQQSLVLQAYASSFKLVSSAQNADWIRLDLQRI